MKSNGLKMTSTMQQFFGKTTWRVFFGLMVATVIGFALFRVPEAQIVALALILIGGFVAYWLKPELAFVLVFAELFGFSHGRLFAEEIGGFLFTSRMALFVGIMLAWGIKWVLRKVSLKSADIFPFAWFVVIVALGIGLIVGLNNNETRAVLDDFNGYVYALYLLPILSVNWNRLRQCEMIQTIIGASLWISVFSLVLLYTFTHLPNEVLEITYKLVRDARIGEITLMEGGYWRVFIQSQIVLMLGLLFGVSFDLELPKKPLVKKSLFWLLAFVIAGLVISLSRSFWVGLVVGVPVVLYLSLKGKNKLEIIKRFGVWLASGAIAVGLLATVSLTVFPVPSRVVDLREVFSERTTELGDVAISSRWNLLPVMIDEMNESPVLGSGFGKELAFVSDDPRVREIYPDGKWRTYKFEWGWVDLWVKMGFLGFFGFVMIFITYDKLLRENLSNPRWLTNALRASMLALAATNIFSPYLNHPLGIGIILFVTLFLSHGSDVESRVVEKVGEIKEKLKAPKLSPPVPTARKG